MSRALVVSALLLTVSAAHAQSVALAGMLGSKALLVVNGTAPKTVAAGETHEGVKVISTSGDQAVVEQDGKRNTLRVGEAPVNMGASKTGGKGNRIVLVAGTGGHFMTAGQINGTARSQSPYPMFRQRLLRALAPALPALALGGCCYEAEAEMCLLAPEAASCPGRDEAAEQLDVLSIDSEARLVDEETHEVDGERWVEPAQCCYDATVLSCPDANRGFGRPFVTPDGEAVHAEPRRDRDTDWNAGRLRPQLAGVDRRSRERLAARWATRGLAEHAAIASLGRFALELLRFGADPELVLGAARAASDEVRHARACFTLASAYAGRPLAPGPLPLGSTVALAPDRLRFAQALAAEGCLGETLGVAELEFERAHASDPAVVATLAGIIADERRHAELAWRALAWTLGALPMSAARSVVASLRQVPGGCAGMPGVDAAVPRRCREDHGEQPASSVRDAARSAHAEIVVPCAAAIEEALLQRRSPGAERSRGAPGMSRS